MIEHWNLRNHKKAFGLLETLISLIILSIVISGFSLLFTNNISYQIYKDLQDRENEFYQTGKITNSADIKFMTHL